MEVVEQVRGTAAFDVVESLLQLGAAYGDPHLQGDPLLQLRREELIRPLVERMGEPTWHIGLSRS